MKTPGYAPQSLPEPSQISTKNLCIYLLKELAAISGSIKALLEGRTMVHSREPDKPRQGQMVYADGTNWDPGSGEGVYYYSAGGAWVKL